MKYIELLLIVLISGTTVNFFGPLLWAIPDLVELVINIFLFAVLIQVILSWINPGTYNPASALIYSLTEPVMRPARNLLPPISGLDLSPDVGDDRSGSYLKMLLFPPLRAITGSPFT